MIILASLTRILAFIGKELVETWRRPWAVLSLVVGPMVLLLVFGAGYGGTHRPLNTILVVPPGSGLPTDTAAYHPESIPALKLLGVVGSASEGEARLRDGTADVLVIAPGDLQQQLRAGKQSVIRVEYSVIDPIRDSDAQLLAREVSNQANQRLIAGAAAQGEAQLPSPGPSPIPPEVLAAPTRAETVNLAATSPNIVSFFGIAAVALILQHLAVTLFALSLVRERVQGRFELFRVAPVHTFEALLGKGLAYAALATIVAGLAVAVLNGAMSVPDLAPGGSLVLIIALVIGASLALGALIACLSDSERQVVQLSLFLLLASVFFGGFVLSVDEFRPAAQVISYLLPVTHGITLLQNAMLQGSAQPIWQLAALALMVLLFTVASWGLLRRAIAQA
ncbi:MAG: ABC transporter permease [Chloroflexota bacterium]